ncbi:MAG: UDP-N-acetylmuramoyl-L-alanine--D-glutamate ligase, partial [Alphaproteobacteria bacterium]|nr:UDP-N-acetylmuramoyl-L-alanine--D-glutamate ligase [Alphaproteobacteria bacterium]
MSKRYEDFFKGKTCTVMGLGLLGRGTGDVAFLAKLCKKVYVTDMKTEAELKTSLDALKEYDNIEFVLGKHENSLFENKDFIIKGAGVRLDNPFIAHAKNEGIPVYMSTALFAYLSGIKIIGVTGTRGKTTTTNMIYEALRFAGQRAILGGNIRGVSTLSYLHEAHTYDCAVLELDSWQLQGFNTLNVSPNISVFTTFYKDHMNYYDGDMEMYAYDKGTVFRYQKEGDFAIATEEVWEAVKDVKIDSKAKRIVAKALPEDFPLQVLGEHNRLNGGLAKQACLAYGIKEDVVEEALRQYKGAEGRLQLIREYNKRRFYNDTTATTQEATMAALTSFDPKNVVLVFGGADKGLPVDRVLNYVISNNIRAVLIKGTGTDRITGQLPDTPVAGSMAEAMQ